MATKQFQNAKLKVDHLDLSSDTARSALQSGENISHSLGKIARWYKDIVWSDTKATIDAYGIVKLSDDYKSTSTDTVPTSKTLNDVVQLMKQTGGWNTTYDFNSNIDGDENLQNGQFKVTEHDIEGDIDHYVTIKGLGSAAFTDSDEYATAGHTHLYAGSSTAGGVANSAAKLSDVPAGGIGSETKPVYFSGTTGRPVACTYSVNASVPSGAIFTDEKVKQSPVTTNGSFEVLFAGSTGNTEKTEGVGKTTTLVFNPSTGALTATSFSGSGSGLTSLNASNISSGTLAVARLADSGVVAGTYGPAANASLVHAGTFDVPDFTVDAKGRVTGAHTRTFTLPAQYVHPTHTSKTSGLYKITVDSLGHVSATAAIAKTDIPALDYISSTTTRNPNVVLAGPASGTTAAAPTFRSLVAADLPASGATAGSYGPSANATPGYGATFNVPYITVDAKGRVTSISNKTVKIPASDNTNTTYTLSGAYGSGSNTWVTTLTPSSGSATTSTVPVGTTSAYGLMKLYNGVDSTSTALAATANAVKTAYDKANHSHPYLPTAGGTMTGKITCMSDQYTDNYTTGCIDCKNSNIVGINSLVFADLADSSGEGLQFYRTSTTVDTIWVKNGVIYFTPNRTLGSSGTDYTVIHSNNYSSYALPKTTKYASSSSVGGPAYSVEGTSGTDEAFRHVWFSHSTTETRRAYSDAFTFEPSNGILKFTSWYPIDITGMTINLNDYYDGSGKYGYRRYICKTTGGGSNISNKPCDSPFVLEVFLIRFATASTDYITKQVYHAFNKKTYQRFCTNGAWDSWTEMKYTDTNTDTKVTQTATTTSAAYEVLFSGTADNTTRTEGARKNSNLTFNPSIGTLRVTSTSFGTIEVYRNNGSNGAAIRFYNNVVSSAITELGSIGMNAKNGSLLRWSAGAAASYAICDENNTTFTRSLTSGTKIGTLKIGGGTAVDLYCQTNTDTKNTAGSTNTSSKIFLIGATSQAANPQTYSHDTAYVGTDGCLYSNSTKVSVEGHAHGLGHSDFTVFINATTNTWAAIGVDGLKFVLKSIRTDVSAPPYLLGGYSAGIVFGGADTRGVISVSYSNPTIRFAGGPNTTADGGTASWYITLTGTHNTSYDLNTINYVKQSATSTSNYRGVLLGYTTTANTTDTRETTVTNQSYITNKIFVQPSSGSLYATNLSAYVSGSDDVYVRLYRGGNSSWRFINTQGTLKLQNNYYSSAIQSWYTVAQFDHSCGGAIRINTPPTHTSSNRYINYQYNGIAMKVCSKSDWSMGTWWHKNDGSATLGSFGAYGAANALSYYYWGTAYNSTQLRLYPASTGGLVTQQSNGFRMAYNGYGVIFRTDSNNFYILLTDKKTDGSELTGDNWNSKRPLTISLSSGICNINGNAATATTWATARTLTIGSTGKSVNGSANVSWSLSEIGAAASNHTHFKIVTEGDNRKVATTPNDYSNEVRFRGLKEKATINDSTDTPISSSYAYLIGLRGWSDSSGGNSHELAFSNDSILHRNGATTSWGAWRPIAEYVLANGYWGLVVNGSTSAWVRTTTNGIIPVQSGASGSGHSSLGTASWYFSTSYVDTMWGSVVCANRFVSRDGSMDIQPGHSNEVNFGGTSTSANIYFGYRAVGSRPIPVTYTFGSSTGTASIVCDHIKIGGTSTYCIFKYNDTDECVDFVFG